MGVEILMASRAPRSYSLTVESGLMAAGLAANSPILALQWSAPEYMALIRQIRVTAAMAATTAFAEGAVKFAAYMAKSFTVQDTGGGAVSFAATKSQAKASRFAASQFASYGSIRASATATLTAGTRTLDTNPFGSLIGHVGAVPSSVLIPPPGIIFDASVPGRQPIELNAAEGLVIQATVPATGTWNFAITIDWDEMTPSEYLGS